MTRTPPAHRNTKPRSRRALAARAAIGLSALTFMIWSLKSWEPRGMGSRVGSLVARVDPTYIRSTWHPRFRSIWLFTASDGTSIVSDDPPDDFDRITTSESPPRVLQAFISLHPSRYGLLAPTTRKMAWANIDNWTAIVKGLPEARATLTEHEQAALLTWIASEPEEHQPTLRRLLIDQQPEKVILLSGYLWNTAFIIALFLAGYLLSTTPFLWVRDHTIPARRRRQGRCIRCGYPLTTIANQPCPECGLHPPSNPSTTPIPPTP